MKLRVENLANIKEAEVEVKNLTLFVGQNSTHKSYMSHIIYELYKEISSLDSFLGNWGKKNKIITAIIKHIDKKDFEYFNSLNIDVSENIEAEQIDVDEWIEHQSTQVTIHLNNDTATYKSIIERIYSLLLTELTKIINYSFNVDKQIIQKIFIENVLQRLIISDKISINFDIPKEHFDEEKETITTKLLNKLIDNCIFELTKILNKYNISHYFPASRTGFVLTLDEIYAGIFRDKFRGQVSATRLGEPTIDFIQTFADIKTGKSKNFHLFNYDEFMVEDNFNTTPLIEFLETNIIKGKIKEQKNEQNYASYYLDVNGAKLDLHLASSATLETLPFIVFLRDTKNIAKTFFVIEEPEAHLHPKAQIQMAKFLVMLSNTGAKVLVTTHSDYILNEINNCIKLNSIEKENAFAISQENVSAYLFKNEDIKTTVNKLVIDKFGIANDNFDDVLDELLDRSDELNEKILEKND